MSNHHSPAVIRYAMFFFNLIFFLLGCGILGVGIWLKVEKGEYAQVSSFNFVTAANLAIAAGAIILVVGFLGCCGAIKEIRPMLLMFFILLVLIFILEITAGGIAYAKRNELENKLQADFNESISLRYGDKNQQGVTLAIDKFQESFQCCGYNSYMDWQWSRYYHEKGTSHTGTIPKSCCRLSLSECKKNAMQRDTYWQKGCFKEVMDFLKDNLLLIGIVGIVFALVQILGMVFSMVMYCSLGEKGTYA